ncbi:MAG: hypothetical protein POELPBGB_00773 [Bacteroidia bacterium]|nr:hypothetical protein [Bacteroidia bacterium]
MIIACIAGYIWLYLVSMNKPLEVCLIKYVTNLPCPFCGSTRSILSLIKGNFIEALGINPIGFLIAIIMFLSPFWIIADIITKRNTFFNFYHKLKIHLKKPQFAIPLVLLLIINWIWNITKGL